MEFVYEKSATGGGGGFLARGIKKRREVEKRFPANAGSYGVESSGSRLAALSKNIIKATFEQPITQMKTNFDIFMNRDFETLFQNHWLFLQWKGYKAVIFHKNLFSLLYRQLFYCIIPSNEPQYS